MTPEDLKIEESIKRERMRRHYADLALTLFSMLDAEDVSPEEQARLIGDLPR